MEIRDALDSDFDAYCRLMAEVNALHAASEPSHFRVPEGSSLPKTYWDEIRRDPAKVMYFAVEGGKALGVVQAEVRSIPDLGFLIGREYAHVGTLVVHESARRAGLGNVLMEKVEAWARERGLSEMRLNVWDFNGAAKGFYAARGYHCASQTLLKRLKD